ncbi:MAG TPA: bifunctional 4-hydroxy-2-oxoglutarate aldolase/2-dehydro-3-deoxy-phosphogluconate aldolase [Propionibacteriaceae bacterium]|nr:bifunctional 4-hydroxy-2-oxoglutarate aldolase/2-dehydro-3-deoxy-phosphogluconate aldolase [Propionibacteriaceae bacterium]
MDITPIIETLGSKLVVLVPGGTLFADAIAPVEICVQEGLTSLSIPIADLDLLTQLAPLYSARAKLGVHGVVTVVQLEAAAHAGARFVLASVADEELMGAANVLGVTCLPSAFTPTEVLAAGRLGAPGVQVAPADVLGHAYAKALPGLAPDVPVVPRGELGAYALRQWFEAGAVAAVVGDTLTGTAFKGLDLSAFRERCQSFASIAKE